MGPSGHDGDTPPAPIAADLWRRQLALGLADDQTTSPLVVVRLGTEDRTPPPDERLGSTVTTVVIGLASGSGAAPRDEPDAHLCDVVLAEGDPLIEAVARTVAAHPIAAVALAGLLRGSETRPVLDGLLTESAVYSTLQAGPEFRAWRASRPVRTRETSGDAVAVARHGDRLEVVLDRPEVRNALDTTMREQLTDALGIARLDPSVTEIHLRGAGPAFCAGGDLDEFGSFADPATAHLIRTRRSPAWAAHLVADRLTAHLHGACMGSGIEIPAYAGRVVARPDTTIGLPEVSLGLIPGAGGTVSLPRRIGRHRTALLALSGHRIDAPTALRWGLVDELRNHMQTATLSG